MFFELNGEIGFNESKKTFTVTERDGDVGEIVKTIKAMGGAVVSAAEVDAGDEDCSKCFAVVEFRFPSREELRASFAVSRKEWIRWTKGSANDFELECRRKLMEAGIASPTPAQWADKAQLLVAEIHEVLNAL